MVTVHYYTTDGMAVAQPFPQPAFIPRIDETVYLGKTWFIVRHVIHKMAPPAFVGSPWTQQIFVVVSPGHPGLLHTGITTQVEK